MPAFVAVIGKVRTFTPEEGTLYVSVRPELVREVNAEARDRWIIETCQQTKQRIQAMTEAMKMTQANVYDLRKLGYSKELSEGVVAAVKRYGTVDIGKYVSLIRESLQYIVPAGEATFDQVQKDEKLEIKERKKKPKRKGKTEKTEEEPPAEETPEDPETLSVEVH